MSGTWIRLFFEPLDVLLFRDHRPFDAGLHFRARLRMPFPTTFVGCLRTAMFRALGANFSRKQPGEFFGIDTPWAREFLGGAHEPVGFQFQGPLLAKYKPKAKDNRSERLDLFFPPPADLRIPRGANEPIRLTLEPPPAGLKRYRWNGTRMTAVNPEHCSPRLPEGQTEKNEPLNGFLTEAGASWWCNGADLQQWHNDGSMLVTQDTLYRVEERTGIARDDSLTAIEGMFYMPQMMRFAENAGFAAAIFVQTDDEAKLVHALNDRTVTLGGKNRRTRLRVMQQTGPLLEGIGGSRSGERAALGWFVTPAMGTVDALAAALGTTNTGAVTQRTIPAGGFDLALEAPKPLWSTVGAGSVVAFEHTPAMALPAAVNSLDAPVGLAERYGSAEQLGYGLVLWG